MKKNHFLTSFLTFITFGLGVALSFSVSLPSSAQTSAQNIAVVDGKPISQAMLNLLLAQQKKQGQEDTPELRAMLKDELINRAVVMQEAERLNIAKDPDIATQMELARQTILIRGVATTFKKKNPISAADVQKEYDDYKNSMGNKEFQSRHILVATEAEAQDIIKRIRAGEKFEALAEAKSSDSGSAKNGGELGWGSSGSYVKPFADALANLKPGQMTSEPVKSEFGYHVIRVDEIRDAKLIPFEEVKQQIEDSLLEKRLQAYQAQLRSKAKVE